MTIIIDGNNITHIIDGIFKKARLVFLPEWINDAVPDIDTNVWNRKVIYMTYVMRVTDAEKWILDQLLTGHQLVTLQDNVSATECDAWVKSIEAEWEGNINWLKPWKVTIESITETLHNLYEFIEYWNFGPPSIIPLIHTEGWNYPDVPASETLFEHASNTIVLFADGDLAGQTFTPQTTHKLTSLRLRLKRMVPASAGDFIVSIRNIDENGYPTGDDLVSTSISTSSIPTDETEMIFIFDTYITLNANTKYAIVVRCTNVADFINIRLSDDYPRGDRLWYDTQWHADTNNDFWFEEYGLYPEEYRGFVLLFSEEWTS